MMIKHQYINSMTKSFSIRHKFLLALWCQEAPFLHFSPLHRSLSKLQTTHPFFPSRSQYSSQNTSRSWLLWILDYWKRKLCFLLLPWLSYLFNAISRLLASSISLHAPLQTIECIHFLWVNTWCTCITHTIYPMQEQEYLLPIGACGWSLYPKEILMFLLRD